MIFCIIIVEFAVLWSFNIILNPMGFLLLNRKWLYIRLLLNVLWLNNLCVSLYTLTCWLYCCYVGWCWWGDVVTHVGDRLTHSSCDHIVAGVAGGYSRTTLLTHLAVTVNRALLVVCWYVGVSLLGLLAVSGVGSVYLISVVVSFNIVVILSSDNFWSLISSCKWLSSITNIGCLT